MKLILENWRKYLNEEQWSIHPKIEKQIQNLLKLPSDVIIIIEGIGYYISSMFNFFY